MKQIESWLVNTFRVLIGISFAVLIGSVLIQVVWRTFGSSPIWTEELSRYGLLYVAAIGAGLSLRSGDLVNVDIVCEAFGEAWAWRLRLLSAILTACMCAVLFIPAWRFVAIGALQTSPAMGIQMTYVHFSVFALLVILFLFSLLRVIGMLIYKDSGRPASFQKHH